MKKKVILSFCALALMMCLPSCKGKVPTNSSSIGEEQSESTNTHTHTFASEWSSDETYHWHAATCEHTSEVSDKAEHTWVDTTDKDVAATETSTGKDYKKCSVCGYETYTEIPMLEHVHTFASEWSSDETYHWHIATCEHSTEVSGKAAHTFGDWNKVKDASYTEDGKEERTCSVCSYVDSRTITKLAQEDVTFTLKTTTKEYDGNAVTLEKATDYTLPVDYNGEVDINFYSDEALENEVTAVNAGTYYLVATLPATDKYKSFTSEPIEFKISEKILTDVKISTIYDGTNERSGIVLGEEHGIINGDVVTAKIERADRDSSLFEVKYSPIDLCALGARQQGYSEVTLEGKDASNYYFEYGTLTITQATNEWKTAPTINGWTYGDANTFFPTAEAKFGNDSITYTYQKLKTINGDLSIWGNLLKAPDSKSSAGEYQVKATIAGTDNYAELTSSYVKFKITQKTLNNFRISAMPADSDIVAGDGVYAGKYYYEHTLTAEDTNCLITGDEVIVRIYCAAEDDLTDYMNGSLDLVNSIDEISASSTAYIEIVGGADGNNYQIGTTDLGRYTPDN